MAIKDRTTTTMKFTDARAHLSEIFNQVARQETRVIVEKNGVAVGTIISPKDYERFQRFEREEREKYAAAFTRIGEAFKDVPTDELGREIELAIAEARAELRAEKALSARELSGEEYEREYARELDKAREDYRAETELAEQQE